MFLSRFFFPPLFAYDFQPFQSRWRTNLTKGLGRMADASRPFQCVKEPTTTGEKKINVQELKLEGTHLR